MLTLGIDIGGTGIKGAPVDTISGELTAERFRVDTPQPATPTAIAHAVQELVHEFAWTGPVGCAFPARVKQGVSLTASNISPEFVGLNVRDLLARATGLPITLLNDADAAGVAEMHFGAAQNHAGLVLMVTLGTGIGTALFTNGHLVPNSELGHVVLPTGRVAEPYASNKTRKEEDLSWKKWAGRVQEYLAHMEFLFAPDLIVIGGGVSRPDRWEKFAGMLTTRAEMRPAQLGNNAGIVGAAWQARILDR